jgi:hypothetical protein
VGWIAFWPQLPVAKFTHLCEPRGGESTAATALVAARGKKIASPYRQYRSEIAIIDQALRATYTKTVSLSYRGRARLSWRLRPCRALTDGAGWIRACRSGRARYLLPLSVRIGGREAALLRQWNSRHSPAPIVESLHGWRLCDGWWWARAWRLRVALGHRQQRNEYRKTSRDHGLSIPGRDAPKPVRSADQFQPPCGQSTAAALMVQAAGCLIFAPDAPGLA